MVFVALQGCLAKIGGLAIVAVEDQANPPRITAIVQMGVDAATIPHVWEDRIIANPMAESFR
jgi:hypothetical protein